MNDHDFLQKARILANSSNEPVKCGSILVGRDSKVVASAYNSQRDDGMVASHAEMKAIALANTTLGRKLTGITAYGNCEPCTMCLAALIFSGVDRVVFSQRLNDLVEEDKKITIDCFDFVKKFPHPPLIEHIPLT